MKVYTKGGFTYGEIIMPSNFHVHWREISQFFWTVGWSAVQFRYALGMLNTKKPLADVIDANSYCIEAQTEGKLVNKQFRPFVALYLTDETTVEDIDAAVKSAYILAAKLYPCGATTGSDSGVTNLKKMWPIFARMEEKDLPLCLHGEVTNPKVALWDRERVFVDMKLSLIHDAFPKLRIILEHVSTKEGVQFIQSTPPNVAATVAPQYMLFNCNDVYMWPSRNCYPVINSPTDQESVISLAVSGRKDCFLGTDGASHADEYKFCDGGNGGCLNEFYAIPLYLKAFEHAESVKKFNDFAGVFGPQFYNLELPTEIMKVCRTPHIVERCTQISSDKFGTPFLAGEVLDWQVDEILL
ncbi:MAG: dihydroorotase [Candidatus Moraniibacteriota bacterium]|jgi:dihydroorotase